jgi:hypothetical protein
MLVSRVQKRLVLSTLPYIGFQSLQESIDSTTSGGRLIFRIFGTLAEFERNLIRERTHANPNPLHYSSPPSVNNPLKSPIFTPK